MDEVAIQKLAKAVVAQFVSELDDTAEIQVLEIGGNHIMIVTPNMNVPYASLHINLEMQVEEWMRVYLPPRSVAAHPHATTHLFEAFLRQIAVNVPNLLFDFLVLLNFIKARAYIEAAYGTLSETLQASGVEAANKYIQDMLQRYKLAENIGPGRPKTINTNEMFSVVRNSLINRTRLSQNRLAKELKVKPAAIRTWLRKRGYKSLEELVVAFDEHFHQTVGPNCRMKKGKRGNN